MRNFIVSGFATIKTFIPFRGDPNVGHNETSHVPFEVLIDTDNCYPSRSKILEKVRDKIVFVESIAVFNVIKMTELEDWNYNHGEVGLYE